MKSGAQKGNKNGSGRHEWSDAVRALKEIGDRLDGKAIQAIEGRLDTTITIVQVTFGSNPMRPCINGSTDTKQLDSP